MEIGKTLTEPFNNLKSSLDLYNVESIAAPSTDDETDHAQPKPDFEAELEK